MTDDEMLAVCEQAGVLPHEMSRAPDGTLLLSATGVRKLTAIAPNRHAAAALNQHVTKEMRARIRPVES